MNRIEPKPVTKKLSEILAGNDDLRVVAIKVATAKPLVIEKRQLTQWALSRDLTWNDNWNAWSMRPFNDIYQQIIIFVPRVDE